MDEKPAIGAGNIDIGNLSICQRFQRLANIERQLQRAGKQVHGAGGHDAERDAVFPGNTGSRRNRAVTAAGNDAFDIRLIGGPLHFLNDILSGNQPAIDHVPGAGKDLAGVVAIGIHIRGAKGAAVTIENCYELHVPT